MVQISQRLMLQQKQSPQQVLLSTLLQLPVLRLEQRIKQERELKPLLEMETELDEEMEQTEEEEEEKLEEVKLEEAKKEEENPEDEKEKELQEEDLDWDTILNDEDNYEIKQPREPIEEDIDRPEPSPVTLMDHLMEQLHLAPLSPEEQVIGEYILW